MKKMIFTLLMIAFVCSPLISIWGGNCHADDDGHFCQMVHDLQEHEQETNHCQGCAVSFSVPKVQVFSFFVEAAHDVLSALDDSFAFLDTDNNLYRPPIV